MGPFYTRVVVFLGWNNCVNSRILWWWKKHAAVLFCSDTSVRSVQALGNGRAGPQPSVAAALGTRRSPLACASCNVRRPGLQPALVASRPALGRGMFCCCSSLKTRQETKQTMKGKKEKKTYINRSQFYGTKSDTETELHANTAGSRCGFAALAGAYTPRGSSGGVLTPGTPPEA